MANARSKIAQALADPPPQGGAGGGGDDGGGMEPMDGAGDSADEGEELQQKLQGMAPDQLVGIIVQVAGLDPRLGQIVEQIADQSGQGAPPPGGPGGPPPGGQPSPAPMG